MLTPKLLGGGRPNSPLLDYSTPLLGNVSLMQMKTRKMRQHMGWIKSLPAKSAEKLPKNWVEKLTKISQTKKNVSNKPSVSKSPLP